MFLATVNYRGNTALPLFPRYPQSSSISLLNWSFPRSTVILITATLPGSFLPGTPSGASSLEDVSATGGLLSEVLHLHVHQHQEGQDRHHEDQHQY
jgi:hypothetical protein